MAKDNDTKTEAPSTITPGQLAEELDQDPKRIRAYLRAEFARDKSQKNTSWAIDEETADAVRAHFAGDDDEDADDELEETD
jgi:Translation initiation factor IF-2, N-terminal region.